MSKKEKPATKEEKDLLMDLTDDFYGIWTPFAKEKAVEALRSHVRSHAPAALLEDERAVDVGGELVWQNKPSFGYPPFKWSNVPEETKEECREQFRALLNKLQQLPAKGERE